MDPSPYDCMYVRARTEWLVDLIRAASCTYMALNLRWVVWDHSLWNYRFYANFSTNRKTNRPIMCLVFMVSLDIGRYMYLFVLVTHCEITRVLAIKELQPWLSNLVSASNCFIAIVWTLYGHVSHRILTIIFCATAIWSHVLTDS